MVKLPTADLSQYEVELDGVLGPQGATSVTARLTDLVGPGSQYFTVSAGDWLARANVKPNQF